jgi:hypothetical protein
MNNHTNHEFMFHALELVAQDVNAVSHTGPATKSECIVKLGLSSPAAVSELLSWQEGKQLIEVD